MKDKDFRTRITNMINKETAYEAIKYLFVGGFCTIIDFLFLFLLTEVFKVNYVFSSAISFSIAVLINYFLCIFWIFKIRSVKNPKKEFIFYITISIVGLLLNTFLIWLLTEKFSIQFMISKILSTPIVLTWNFLGRKYFLHGK
jgi:putative flippase GtrA